MDEGQSMVLNAEIQRSICSIMTALQSSESEDEDDKEKTASV
jgi:hypothetical protein